MTVTQEHVELVALADGTVLFVKSRDIDYVPTMRLLHKYPFMMPHQQVRRPSSTVGVL